MQYESATNASVSPAGRQNPGTRYGHRSHTKTAKAHIVILFGSYARGDYKLERGLEQGKKSDYDLLVITADSDSRRAISLELTRAFDDIATPVQLVVETIATVNANLSERQFFFSDIRREGIMLYDSGQYTLAEPAEISREQRRKMAEDDFKMWFNEANEFWLHAEFSI